METNNNYQFNRMGLLFGSKESKPANGDFLIGDYDFSMSDRERLEFHIECEDYFGTLATVLDLITQDEKPVTNERYIEILKNIKDDLIFLQKHYRIERKN